MHNERTTKLTGAFILGGLAGWAVSMLIPPQAKTNMRNTMRSKVKYLQEIITDPDERERIMEVFGEKTENARETFVDVKDALVDNLANLGDSLSELNKQKYLNVVRDTLDEFKKEKRIAGEQLTKLQKYLESDYRRIRTKLRTASEDLEDEMEA